MGELEEHIKQIEEEDELEQNALRIDVEHLEREVSKYKTDVELLIEKCRRLEDELAAERIEKGTMAAIPTDMSNPNSDVAPQAQPSEMSNAREDLDAPMGCGNCSSATNCRCIDEAFNVSSATTASAENEPSSKRPRSAIPSTNNKRVKVEPNEGLEIDFTNAFTSRPLLSSSSKAELVSPTSAMADPCGFCQDGTPCICAEMAAVDDQEREAAASLRDVATKQSCTSGLVPGVDQFSQFTPPPSEGDVSSAARPGSSANLCASGPGTCAQCRGDPNSTLFCKSLAASRAEPSSTPPGCCGGSSSSASCCQVQSRTSRKTRSKTATSDISAPPTQTGRKIILPSITLTCADAYTTLSRHPGYEKASGDIATWMPKLHANATSKSLEGRPAMELDAANVMSVLKDFDRRFGENC